MKPDRVRIILVRPGHPGNVGSAARAMKNMGFSRMVLVSPACDPQDSEALRLAYGAQELLKEAAIFNTLPEALSGIRFAVGLTGHPFQGYEPPTPLPRAASEIAAWGEEHPIALLFGAEGTGLTTEEIALCHRLVTIPAPGPHPSLNLSQAVMVTLYELVRESMLPALPTIPADAATLEDQEHLYDAWRELLTEGRLIRGNQGKSLITRLRRILSRTALTREEARMIQGILRQILWRLRHPGKG